ncbi:receptor-interacting serine/threonine-protein kinase 3 [Brachionichthys hirsutus]|uniref:receptor-interacting serine/threonine-protein kinase 3 n=1 Tax=Brachionichthys hirsutus TaxID=412623 RepID=UPI003604EC71
MELSSYPVLHIVQDTCLAEWEVIGSGGFGQVYKARHRKWCCNVAIKLLYHDNGNSASLLREIQMMCQGSSPYVIQVLGMFKGRLPSSGPSVQLGLVMEVMERGSLACLQDTLQATPPWPLVYRLAHQVALGINFLHSLSPALLHLDLKPSNVLLDSYINAKLTDFGLARFCQSITRVSKKDSEDEGGTISYMPPEAFEISYSPTRASDIYSYGILLWSIVTGKQPYANAMSSIVRFRIPQGDRPSLDEIRSQAVGIAGLTGLMNLMEKCWDTKPNQRPTSYVCTTETEELYKIHKHSIVDAVHQVLKEMDRKEQSLTERVQGIYITEASAARTRFESVNAYDVPTGCPPVQEMVAGWITNQGGKDRFKDPHPSQASMTDGNLGGESSDDKVKVSSVHPIRSTPSTRGSPEGTAAQISQPDLRPNQRHAQPTESRLKDALPQKVATQAPALMERQFSNPDALPWHRPRALGVHIQLSNVTGFQHGNNNTMHIYAADSSERKRHATAPSSVNLPLPRSRREKT